MGNSLTAVMTCRCIPDESPEFFADARSLCSYVFSTRIGTPPQNLHLAYGTGAGDFWVWSWLLPTYMLENRTYYNASISSSSSQWQGQSFGVTYGLGSTLRPRVARYYLHRRHWCGWEPDRVRTKRCGIFCENTYFSGWIPWPQ
jgi:hypothetical protein